MIPGVTVAIGLPFAMFSRKRLVTARGPSVGECGVRIGVTMRDVVTIFVVVIPACLARGAAVVVSIVMRPAGDERRYENIIEWKMVHFEFEFIFSHSLVVIVKTPHWRPGSVVPVIVVAIVRRRRRAFQLTRWMAHMNTMAWRRRGGRRRRAFSPVHAASAVGVDASVVAALATSAIAVFGRSGGVEMLLGFGCHGASSRWGRRG